MSQIMITCSSCRQAKSPESYSKSQRKRWQADSTTSVICEPCKGNIVVPVAEVSQSSAVSSKGKHDVEPTSADPSLANFKQPMRAPIVKTFQSFFKDTYPDHFPSTSPPEVFYSHKKYGWRTASKLSVRSEITKNGSDTLFTTKIGLFEPGSHSVVDCSKSPIHHPSINHAIITIRQSMDKVKLFGYHDSIGDNLAELERTHACVKYIVLSVQRHTKAVQLTLVTQSPRDNTVINPLLDRLVEDLVSTSTASAASVSTPAMTSTDGATTEVPKVTFHSIWVNHHFASRHCNTVTGRETADWRLLYGDDPFLVEYLDEPVEAVTSEGEKKDGKQYNEKRKTQGGKNKDNKLNKESTEAETHSAKMDASPGDEAQPETSSSTKTPEDALVPVPLHFPPFVFRQANISVFRTIVHEVRRWLRDMTSVSAETTSTLRGMTNKLDNIDCLELYGGVGTIGLHCLDLVRRLVCSDENPHNDSCFQRSLQAIRATQGDALARRISYLTGKSADLAMQGLIHRDFDVLVVDPPRKGLEPEVMEQLLLLDPHNSLKHKAPAQNKKKIFSDVDETEAAEHVDDSTQRKRTLKRLIYVSCGFEAFQRDCQMLTGEAAALKGYTVSQTTSYPTAPGATGPLAIAQQHQRGGSSVHTHYHHVGKKHQNKRARLEDAAVPDDAYATAFDATPRCKWRLVFAKGYLMFPGANHIETLAVFDRID